MNWDGLLLVNKPSGFTSHTVVQKVRERLLMEKAGHLGTLDPLATGLFPVCLGKATRLVPFYMKADKAYITQIRFGYFTSTDDREGKPEGSYQKLRFNRAQLEETVAKFEGEHIQKPPLYSAKKIQGKRAYDLARKGETPDIPLQHVRIYEMKLLHFEKDLATVYISCSSGTYVRALAREIGMHLKCGAHVHELARTRFGEFALDKACSPVAPEAELRKCFTPLETMLTQFPEVVLSPELSRRILSGSPVDAPQPFAEGWIRVFDEARALLAFAQVGLVDSKQRIQPRIVFGN